MIWPDLTDVLLGIPWAVAGAVATRMYMPERTTRDLDVVIIAADSTRAAAALSSAGWEKAGQPTIGGSSWSGPDRQELDLIEMSESWWTDALEEAQTNRDAQSLPVLPLPYLVLMKFRASRTIDIGDITRILGGATGAQIEATRNLFSEVEPNGLEDLESLIQLGHWEVHGE